MNSDKVFIVYYDYTETFCSPHSSEWEVRQKVICATTKSELAEQKCNEHNQTAEWNKQAKIKSYDLI